MKTILVIYTNNKITKVGYQKRYAFNTKSEAKEGDMIQSVSYNTCMQVVKVMDKEFKYFNKETGDLSNKFSNSNQYEIRTLEICDVQDNVIIGTRIKEN